MSDRLLHTAASVRTDPVAADHDRLARFQREAELLASLNHPQGCGLSELYGGV